jgi:hypothetical protein
MGLIKNNSKVKGTGRWCQTREENKDNDERN